MSRLKTLQKLEDYWITINEIENRADAAYRALLAQLFDSDLDVVTMIKIKEVWMRSKARRMPLNR